MESQIIDFYNEIPYGVNVIDKMNEELDELQKKYNELEKKYNELNNKYKAPYIIVKTNEEYKNYDDIISNQFKIKIKEFIEDEEIGLFAILNSYYPFLWKTIYNKFTFYYHDHEETCMDKIINELNNITNNKNKEWCEWRIRISFESCLKKYSNLQDLDEGDIIEDLIHHIYNDEDNDYLPQMYTEMCNRLVPYSGYGLYNLTCYHCKKCGEFDYYDENLICMDCNYP